MSRSYKKVIKQGICTGKNTEFYRDMNRKCRNKNNHELRNLLANCDIEEVNDLVMTHVPIHDNWNEPTDGTLLITKKDKKRYTNRMAFLQEENPEHWWNRKFGKYLKDKHNPFQVKG